jgi:protein-L-isoaspartate(D-aspartate) O-methyltransferase
MLEELRNHLKPGMSALDVGSGSGYLAACMAEMVGPTGKVIGIDHISELVEMSRRNIEKDKPEFLRDGRLKLFTGDGRQGKAEEGGFDSIHVGAAAPHVPKPLLEQLKPNGVMVIPVGTMMQEVDLTATSEPTRPYLILLSAVVKTARQNPPQTRRLV